MALKDTYFVVLYIISINNVRKMSAKCPQRCLKVPEIKETLLDF